MSRLVISAALVVISLATAGAAARNRGVDRRGVLEAIAQAPAKARAWKNPYDNQPSAIAAGAKLYRQHCAECHGEDARGIGRAADLHSTGVQNATPGEIAWFLRNGNLASGMPSWSGLPEARRWQIVAYLKTLD
ncbi:MAG TPA: c-type cytochrome [Verrucomicrobiae bacterium]|nr:c-type cytochrome [Verrucomicrobiae bacterium]